VGFVRRVVVPGSRTVNPMGEEAKGRQQGNHSREGFVRRAGEPWQQAEKEEEKEKEKDK
jgi:hypothetical protein